MSHVIAWSCSKLSAVRQWMNMANAHIKLRPPPFCAAPGKSLSRRGTCIAFVCSDKSGPKDQVALQYFAFALVQDSRGIEIVNFITAAALSAGTLMASAGTPYRLVSAHFYPCLSGRLWAMTMGDVCIFGLGLQIDRRTHDNIPLPLAGVGVINE